MKEDKKKKLLKALEDGKIVDDKSLALYQILDDAHDLVDRAEEVSNSVDEKIKSSKEDIIQQITPNEEDILNILKPFIPEVSDGDDGHTPTKEELLALIIPLIPKTKEGKTPTQSELLQLINPLLPNVTEIASEASRMAENRLKPFIPAIEDIEKDLPKLGDKIRDGLELLQGEDRLDARYIKGWDERVSKIEKELSIKQNIGGGISGRDVFQDIDISSQFDGVTTTFNIPAVWKIISVDLSSYPYGSARKNIDYTWTPTSITFTSNIDPTTQLSAGQSCILTVITSP